MSSILSTLIKLTLLSSFCLAQNSKFHGLQESLATVCETTHQLGYDSGPVETASTRVEHRGSPWIQLNLSGSKLAPGATIIIRKDGMKVEEFDMATLISSNFFSEVIDAQSVEVQLAAGSGRSTLKISDYISGTCDGGVGSESICGDTDDRVPSTDVRQGRIGGCTGWLISEDVFIQAGHCGTPSSSTRMHFTYGTSNAAPEDQYAVDVASYQGVNGGVGNDWGAGRLLPNSVTGKLPGVAQSEKCNTPGCGWYTLGVVPASTSGNNIRITGYGTAAVASRSQKTHVGALVGTTGTSLSYVPDTTGGNSGSPVVHEETGDAIGVHTHGGCSATGGSNKGTRIDLPAFSSHVNILLGNTPTAPPTVPPPTPAPTPCTSGVGFKVTVNTDNYPGETEWTLVNDCTNQEVEEGGPYTAAGTEYIEEVCIPSARYTFTITDSYGDGICCSYGEGSYEVVYDGEVVKSGGQFGSSESHSFGLCPTAAPTIAPIAPSIAPVPAPVTAPTGDAWETIYSDNFESGQGMFKGNNKRFDEFSTPGGTWSLRLRKASVLVTEWIDVNTFSELSFKFMTYATGMEDDDGFVLNVKFNGDGPNWTTQEEWIKGTDFPNESWAELSTDIDIPDGKTSMKIQFRGTSDAANDKVYIDDVLLEGLVG